MRRMARHNLRSHLAVEREVRLRPARDEAKLSVKRKQLREERAARDGLSCCCFPRVSCAVAGAFVEPVLSVLSAVRFAHESKARDQG